MKFLTHLQQGLLMLSKPVSIILFVSFFAFAEKTNIAVVDFEARGVQPFEAQSLTDKFRGELLNTGAFTVIERGQMESILKEQGFHQTGCVKQECIVEMGQLIGVSKIIAGSIGKVGETFLISARLIDVATGTIVNNVDEEITGRIEDLLRYGMRNVALKIVNSPNNMSTSPGTVAGAHTCGLFIRVWPSGVQTIINGKNYGKGNVFVQDVSPGKILVTGVYLNSTKTITTEIFAGIVDTVEMNMVNNWTFSAGYSLQVFAAAGTFYQPRIGLGLQHSRHYLGVEVMLPDLGNNMVAGGGDAYSPPVGGGIAYVYDFAQLSPAVSIGAGAKAGFWLYTHNSDQSTLPPYEYQASESSGYFCAPKLQFKIAAGKITFLSEYSIIIAEDFNVLHEINCSLRINVSK